MKRINAKLPSASSGHTRALSLIDRPMVVWPELVQGLSPAERDSLSRELDSLIERAARARGYIEKRGPMGKSDWGHAAGVTASNALANRIRKALGYGPFSVSW